MCCGEFIVFMLGCMHVTPQVSKINDFEWQKQLRYYWDVDVDDCIVRMSNSVYHYGYEYLGASPRLVITPLTVSTFLPVRIVATCLSLVVCLSGSLLPVCD